MFREERETGEGQQRQKEGGAGRREEEEEEEEEEWTPGGESNSDEVNGKKEKSEARESEMWKEEEEEGGDEECDEYYNITDVYIYQKKINGQWCEKNVTSIFDLPKFSFSVSIEERESVQFVGHSIYRTYLKSIFVLYHKTASRCFVVFFAAIFFCR